MLGGSLNFHLTGPVVPGKDQCHGHRPFPVRIGPELTRVGICPHHPPALSFLHEKRLSFGRHSLFQTFCHSDTGIQSARLEYTTMAPRKPWSMASCSPFPGVSDPESGDGSQSYGESSEASNSSTLVSTK